MRRLSSLAFVAVTALVGTLLVTAPADAAPKGRLPQIAKGTIIQPSMFGMHVANLESGAWPTVPVGSVRLWDNQTSWANIERTQGNFDWTNLDNSVATAQKNGVNDILMVLAGTPSWASDDPSAVALPMAGASGMPKDFSWWDTWVTQVVTRYKGRITSYQPWNEANLATFSTGSANEMADLTKRAYDIIKRIDPNATVVAPSTGTRLGGPFKKFYPAFLRALGDRGWPIDVWSAHTYPASLGTPADRAGLAKQWEAVLESVNAPTKPLWDTENNFGLKGPGAANPDMDIEGEQASDWVGRTYLDALRLGMSRVYWYRWETYNDLWGIQMYSGTQGATAFKNLQKWIVGAAYQGCTTAGTKVTCSFTRDGAPFRIVYTDNGRAASFSTAGAKQQCELTGACTPLTRKKVKTNGPLLLKN